MFHVTIGIRKARYRYPRRISVWRSVRHYKDVVICRPGTQEMAAADLRMIYGPGGIHVRVLVHRGVVCVEAQFLGKTSQKISL